MTEFIWTKDIREYPAFYMKMFGNREITKALELQNHYDDCDEWLLAVQNNELLGFSGYEFLKGVFILKRSFVFPKYRKVGLYRKMLDMRISKAKEMKATIIQATCTPMSKEAFIARGFISMKQYKRFQTFRMML